MKNLKIFIFLNIAILLLTSCATVKEGFQNPKKNNSDEFLVEKKSPLVMPPDFDELPIPRVDENKTETGRNSIKELITENSSDNKNNINENKDLEASILDKINSSSEIFSSKFLNVYLIWNEGIAFGLLSFNQNSLYNFLTFFILIIIFVIFYMINKSSGLRKYSLLIILGGALGNVYDRIIYKAVPDFIDIHVGNFHWFIFNVSDIFISVGVILMVILEILDKPKKI